MNCFSSSRNRTLKHNPATDKPQISVKCSFLVIKLLILVNKLSESASKKNMEIDLSQTKVTVSPKEKDLNDWLPVTSSRNGKWWYSAFHNVTAMVGAGVLGLPFAMSELGWYVFM